MFMFMYFIRTFKHIYEVRELLYSVPGLRHIKVGEVNQGPGYVRRLWLFVAVNILLST